MPNQELASINVASTEGQGFGKLRAISHLFRYSNLMFYRFCCRFAPLYRSHSASFRTLASLAPKGNPSRLGRGRHYHHFTIIIAVLIVVGVGSLNDWQREKQSEALNKEREECSVKVGCDGREQVIDVHLVVMGDIV